MRYAVCMYCPGRGAVWSFEWVVEGRERESLGHASYGVARAGTRGHEMTVCRLPAFGLLTF